LQHAALIVWEPATPVAGAVSFCEQREMFCVMILSLAKIIKVVIIEEWKDSNVLFQTILNHFFNFVKYYLDMQLLVVMFCCLHLIGACMSLFYVQV
jgi:hypothetical protein